MSIDTTIDPSYSHPPEGWQRTTIRTTVITTYYVRAERTRSLPRVTGS
jgi:hypothetical protein